MGKKPREKKQRKKMPPTNPTRRHALLAGLTLSLCLALAAYAQLRVRPEQVVNLKLNPAQVELTNGKPASLTLLAKIMKGYHINSNKPLEEYLLFCIGPILGATLMMAATRDSLAQGVFLLMIYSAGLAIPFLITSFTLDRFMSFYKNFRRYMQWVERGAGVLLIAVGFLIFFNRFTLVSNYLSFLNDLVLWLENVVT